jgi:adenine-specific DNA-methyltransferase
LVNAYENQIKLIYIDPPYNTGKEAFVYADKFEFDDEELRSALGYTDIEIARLKSIQGKSSHSAWLTFMYPHLKIAQKLLSPDGIILINMDENEITNLQKLCEEVFGEANDLGTIIWDKRNPQGDARGISYQHEYILAYAKNKDSCLEKCKMERSKKNADVMLKKASQIFKKIGTAYSLDDAKEMRNNNMTYYCILGEIE